MFEDWTSEAALTRAWRRTRKNRGAPGGDGCRITDFKAEAPERIRKLSAALRGGSYRPGPWRLARGPSV